MHGFIFFLGPEWYRLSASKDTEASGASVPQNHIVRRRALETAGMDVALAFTLAVALAINIALLAHYIG